MYFHGLDPLTNFVSTNLLYPMAFHGIPPGCHIIPLKYHGNNITSMAFHGIPWHSMEFHGIPPGCHRILLKFHGNNITSMAFHRSPLHSTWMPYNSIEMPWKSIETIKTNQSQRRGPAAPGWYWYNVSCRDRCDRMGHHRHDEWSRCDSHEWYK